MEHEERPYFTPRIERRQHRRIKLVIQVRCQVLGRIELLLTRDVGPGGMFVSSEDPLPMGSEVVLTFRLAFSGPDISCGGRVIYVVDGLGMGIQFTDLNEEARRALQEFVGEAS